MDLIALTSLIGLEAKMVRHCWEITLQDCKELNSFSPSGDFLMHSMSLMDLVALTSLISS